MKPLRLFATYRCPRPVQCLLEPSQRPNVRTWNKTSIEESVHTQTNSYRTRCAGLGEQGEGMSVVELVRVACSKWLQLAQEMRRAAPIIRSSAHRPRL